MNETKLAEPTIDVRNEREAAREPLSDIRLLDDLELMLAGGGDGELNWP